MISWIWTQIKKHRRKLIYGGIFFGGVYMAYRYAHKRIKEIQEKEANECLTHARRQHHFDSNQRTCNMTVLSMVPNLREILQQMFDTESITESLKSNPSNKLELWEELKILSMTRMVCVIYVCSMMSLIVRIQLNVIGGYIYLQNNNTSNQDKERPESLPGQTSTPVLPKSVQEKYLSEIKYLMDKGICQLGELIKSAVKKEISSISLKERLSHQNVESCLQHIRERLETSPEISNLSSPTIQLCPYMFPPETPTEIQGTDDEIHKHLMQETRDILESADFHTVLKTCLDRGFHKLLDLLAESYKTSLQSSDLNNSQSTDYLHGGIPMAKLIPIFNGSLYKLCSDAPNPLMQELLLLESAKTLAANVYEAFSQSPS